MRGDAVIGATDLTRILLSQADVDDLLTMVARTVCESTGFLRSLIVDLDGPSGRVRGRAGHGVPARSVAAVDGHLDEFPVFRMLMGNDGPLVVEPDELRRLVPSGYVQLFQVQGVVVAQPMRSDRLGLLGVVFCDVGAAVGEPTADDIRIVGELSAIAALAFQHALLVRRSVALQGLRERSRIAADLHDGVTQQLYAATLDLDELRSSGALPASTAPVVDRLALRLDTALQQLRSALIQIARGEVPASVTDPDRHTGVVDRTRGLVEDLSGLDGPTADFDVKGEGPEPDADRSDVLVRAVREGLANVMKHAGATQVEVQIRRGSSWWTVEISDDGTGRAETVRRAIANEAIAGFGLRSLSGDAARLGGRIWVSQAPRLHGVRLGLAVPVTIDD